jgi:hypothetical protein
MAKISHPLFFHRESLPLSTGKGATGDKFNGKFRCKASFDEHIFENRDLIPMQIVADKNEAQKHSTYM